MQVNRDAQALFDDTRIRFNFKPEQATHRRGEFPALAVGISYGGGQTVRDIFHGSHAGC